MPEKVYIAYQPHSEVAAPVIFLIRLFWGLRT